jgi:hypothetical protein
LGKGQREERRKKLLKFLVYRPILLPRLRPHGHVEREVEMGEKWDSNALLYLRGEEEVLRDD